MRVFFFQYFQRTLLSHAVHEIYSYFSVPLTTPIMEFSLCTRPSPESAFSPLSQPKHCEKSFRTPSDTQTPLHQAFILMCSSCSNCAFVRFFCATVSRETGIWRPRRGLCISHSDEWAPKEISETVHLFRSMGRDGAWKLHRLWWMANGAEARLRAEFDSCVYHVALISVYEL